MIRLIPLPLELSSIQVVRHLELSGQRVFPANYTVSPSRIGQRRRESMKGYSDYGHALSPPPKPALIFINCNRCTTSLLR
jgi:hypothetical protein